MGGLPFYGRRLLKNAAWVGVALSVLYIVYAFLCFPAQGFNTVSAVGAIAQTITGKTIATNSALYWIAFAVLIVVTALVSFGGIKKITKVTDLLVPIMAVIYVLTVIVLVLVNLTRIPWFFAAVFSGAFQPEAIFGGAFGVGSARALSAASCPTRPDKAPSPCPLPPPTPSIPAIRAAYRRWAYSWTRSLSAR